jgi:peptide-methionine (S)-S-oxide reductase
MMFYPVQSFLDFRRAMTKNVLKFINILIFLFSCLFCKIDAAEIITSSEKYDIATFAGGCFWCMQSAFDEVNGVVSTTVGFSGGDTIKPTYQEVSAGTTGHLEVVQIVYDPTKVCYHDLLNVYFHNIDPTRDDGQFCDKGTQYRPVIFYHCENQKNLAEKYKQDLIDTKKIHPVLVQVLPFQSFYPAEEYHQKYYRKNPLRYKFYRYMCGRDKRLKELWDQNKS